MKLLLLLYFSVSADRLERSLADEGVANKYDVEKMKPDPTKFHLSEKVS